MTDAERLRRTANGDAEAFEGFVSAHEASVLRYVRTLTADAAAAEDALQETFVAAWKAASSFRGEGSARAWLLTIARRALQRQFRRQVGEPAAHLSLEDLALEAGWGSEGVGSFETMLTDRALVQRALARLTPEEREVLLLREVEGFSGDETASMLGVTLAAAKSRLHRARLHFMAASKGELNARA